MIKRFFLAWIFVVFCCSVSQAFLFENKEELRDYRLSNLFLVLSAEEPNKELYIYWELIKKLDRVIKTTTDSNAKILSETLSKLELRYALLEKEMENKSVPRHKTLILKFWAWAKSITSLESRRQEIENIESVFIFRNWSTDLPGYQIASITKKLLEINPELLIFIDQEGWLINRYVEFDGKVSFANYLTTDDYVRDTYNAFSETTKTSLWSVFPTWSR